MPLILDDSLFRDVPNPVWVVETETSRFLDVNQAACKRYGYSREEFLNLTLPDVRRPGGPNPITKQGLGLNPVWEHVTKSGETLFVEGHILPVEGLPEGAILAMIFEVTERVKMEQERTELLERYQILSEAAQDLLWDWDLRNNTVTHNETLVTVYGYDRSYLKADISWWSTLIHPEDLGSSTWSIQEAIREKRRYWSAEYRFKKADGTYIPVLDRGILQTDENDKPVRMIGSIVDLTTRQAAEDERNQLFRLSLDSMLMLDPSGTIRLANDAFYHLVGSTREKGERVDIRQYIATEDQIHFNESLHEVLEDGKENHLTTVIVSSQEQSRTVQWGMIANESKSRIFLIGRDITESIQAQRALELALQQSQEFAEKAQAATKAQSEFLQNMSHELRTPMNGLLGTAQLLAASVADEKQQYFTNILIRSGESLLQILNDILDFSKVESGEIMIDQSPFRISETIQSIHDLFLLPAQQKNLNFILTIDPTANKFVLGDSFRLRQIVNNLVGNAIKFTDHGEIELELSVQPAEDNYILAVVKVRDTGIGIDPSMQGRIFERFIQADSSLTRRQGGTGLGLAITKSLTELMGGQISVVSRPQFGSEFTVKIPFKTTKAPKITQPIPSSPVPQIPLGTRVLIAEDVEVNALILASWLEDRGFECITATTGQETMSMLSNHEFHGIFLDLHMPDYSGYEVIGMVRDMEKESFTHLPVVAVTASVSPEERQRCLDNGFDDYIPKPVMVDDLDRVIHRLFVSKA